MGGKGGGGVTATGMTGGYSVDNEGNKSMEYIPGAFPNGNYPTGGTPLGGVFAGDHNNTGLVGEPRKGANDILGPIVEPEGPNPDPGTAEVSTPLPPATPSTGEAAAKLIPGFQEYWLGGGNGLTPRNAMKTTGTV